VTSEQAHPASTYSSTADDVLAAVRFGIPELVSAHVSRPRLLEALRGADSVPLVLVSGPAGTGKTSLVAEWVRRRADDGSRIGWVTFEDGDPTFWEYLQECLPRLGLDLPPEAGGTTTAGLLGIQRLAALAAAVADAPQHLTLVLDGYELDSLELAHEVDFLLRHTLGRLCLVFVGRVDPVLPLYRYRLSESLLEVRAADLAFSDQEAAELLSSLGVTLGDESVHDLNQRIKGWAAGLRFAARALAGRRHPERSVATVATHSGDITEYLLGEVLEAQPPEIRAFLLDTCVPELLCPGLVAELAGPRAERTLDELARSNAFIEPVPDLPDHYRYYPFFRDLLLAQLAFENAGRMAELHRRTASWLERRGLPERAIGHLAEISAWDEVAARLVGGLLVGRLLLEGPEGPLGSVAERMPATLDDAAAHTVRAAVRLMDADQLGCAAELAAARRTAAEGDEAQRVSVAVLEALHSGRTESARTAATAATQAERALSSGSTRPRTDRESELYALTLLSKGVTMLRLGDLRQARKALTSAVGLDASRRFVRFRAECLGHLALVDLLEGSLSRADRTARESVSVAAEAGLAAAEQAPAAQVALAGAALERYELKAARDHVAAALDCLASGSDPVSSALVEAVMAGLERAGGHLNRALSRLHAAAARLDARDPWLAGHLRLEAARLGVASGRAEQALGDLRAAGEPNDPQVAAVVAAAHAEQGQPAAADEALARARRGQPALATQVTGLLVEMLQESRRHAPGRARTALDRSLRLAAPEELRRPFREAGPGVQRLLAAEPQMLREHAWLSHSAPTSGNGSPRHEGASTPTPQNSAAVVETLTAKELEVLGHLEELLTTEEIAEKMFVSVNTVRTHVRSILRKLGVGRRNAAVRKARELGLFDG
jgi:LuxR family maltose regulon positive regulatory protein